MRFKRFAKISDDKKYADSARAWRGGPQFPKWKPVRPWKATQLAVKRIAIDTSISRANFPALARGLEEVQGPQRCLRARLLILGSMQYLQEFATTGMKQQLCDLIFVIGLGLPVVAATTWRTVGADPTKLDHTQVVFHQPATKIKKKVFRYKRDFKLDHPEVLQALFACGELPGSLWRCQLDKGQPLAPLPKDTELIEVRDLASLGGEILKARALEKGGCRAHATILN